MNKEGFRPLIIDREPIAKPEVQNERQVLRQYSDANFALQDSKRLQEVRRDIAVLPVINVIVPVKQQEVVQQEPKTLGEVVLDLLVGLAGLALVKTGEFFESFGEKNKS
jgi:hypothetical protein